MPFDAPHGVNVAECLALAEFLEGLPPERFDMGDWDCGTTACIGGWMARLAGRSMDLPVQMWATERLGLSFENGRRLFTPSAADIIGRFSPILHAKPIHAAAVLRHLAATGEVDWSVAEGVA